ncbi:MAG: hypothetical protein A3G41_07080 [Elusimicrobia bacterium RIFCSPLOWO2_12_FULL_59_9]|nr:MAG: hypothetical protein A3G41_07080 [Elusimicrobia bacterium RIFCSPLOWO2_12_FULL_59_9]
MKKLMRYRFTIAFAALALGSVVGAALAAVAPGTCEVGPGKPYATIQSAIDDPACLVVRLTLGTFTEKLTVKRTLTLAGSKFGEFTTVLQALADATAIITVEGRRVRLKVTNLELRGPGLAGSLRGIDVLKHARVTVRNSIFRAMRPETIGAGEGFVALHVGEPTGTQVGLANVAETRFEDFQNAAIVVQGPGTQLVLAQSLIIGTGDRGPDTAVPYGVIVRNGARATIFRNDFVDVRHPSGQATAILLDGARLDAKLQYNNIDRSSQGIVLADTHRAVLFRNALDENGEGIVLNGADDVDVLYNRVGGGAGAGLSLAPANGAVVYKNEFRDNDGDAVSVSKTSTDNVLTYNRAQNNGGYGFRDASSGTRTKGTANLYRSNFCAGNALGGSLPAGLCLP